MSERALNDPQGGESWRQDLSHKTFWKTKKIPSAKLIKAYNSTGPGSDRALLEDQRGATHCQLALLMRDPDSSFV